MDLSTKDPSKLIKYKSHSRLPDAGELHVSPSTGQDSRMGPETDQNFRIEAIYEFLPSQDWWNDFEGNYNCFLFFLISLILNDIYHLWLLSNSSL